MGIFDFAGDIFSGVSDAIFGTSPETSITPTGKLTPEQERVLKLLEGLITDRVGSTAEPLNVEQLSLAALEQQAMNLVSGEGGAGEFATGALKDIISGGPQDFEDFFKTTVQDPALQSFERDILPAISGRFATRFFGGERKEAQGRATEDLLESLTRARANLAFQTENANRNRALQAIGLLPQAAGVDTSQLLGILSGAGATRESLATTDARKIQEALAFIGLPTEEIIATTTPGQQGILPGAGSTAANLGVAKLLGVF